MVRLDLAKTCRPGVLFDELLVLHDHERQEGDAELPPFPPSSPALAGRRERSSSLRAFLDTEAATTLSNTMLTFIRASCVLCASLCVTACAPLLAIIGSSPPLIQFIAEAERIKLVGDGVSYVGSGKTITDHVLSTVVGADCSVLNFVSRDPVCAEALSPGMINP
jgi:hypothetical protein